MWIKADLALLDVAGGRDLDETLEDFARLPVGDLSLSRRQRISKSVSYCQRWTKMNYAQRIDFKSIPVIEVARELLGEESKERSQAQEKHFPDHGGLVRQHQQKPLVFSRQREGGDALDLICFVKNCDTGAGIRWLKLHGHVPQSEG